MQVFVVGGAVRDVLLDQEPKDLDFVVVGATEEEMLARGFVRVGADFPVFLDEDGREFALARTERKSGSGHRGFVTEFDSTVTLEDDVIRRDLTINAMAVAVEDWEEFVEFGSHRFVIDLVGGIQDLRQRTLRHVSDAFAEDPLRVLRVARFSARMNFGVHEETMALMRRMVAAGELDDLTPERVWKEMSRAIMERHPHRFFNTMIDADAIHIVADGAEIAFSGSGAMLSQIAREGLSETQRWMALFFDTDEDCVRSFIEQHKLPNEVSRAIMFALHIHSAFYNDPKDVFNVLQQFRLWSDMSLLDEFLEVVRHVDARITPAFNRMVKAARKASRISFASLPQFKRATLKGKEIGDEIARMRMAIIANAA